MGKASKDQEKATKEALAQGKPIPSGVSVNFGRSEPIQTADKKSDEKKD